MKNGLTFLEVLISVFIFSLFLLPTTIFIQKYHRSYILESTCSKIVEGLNFARECAINERENFNVVIDSKSFKILKNGNELVWKEIKLPDEIEIKEITQGINNLTFFPDGMANVAGHLILYDRITKKAKKIKVYNITGKCFIEE